MASTLSILIALEKTYLVFSLILQYVFHDIMIGHTKVNTDFLGIDRLFY